MTQTITHASGMKSDKEILFSTQFNYFFPDAARSGDCLLPKTQTTLDGLIRLGNAMGDPGKIGQPRPGLDSKTPAVFTYLGQFIDHDLTARTDRNASVTDISQNNIVHPVDPDVVIESLRNGRRPQLDLDSVFGDGPSLAAGAKTESDKLYQNYKLRMFEDGNRLDLLRERDKEGNQVANIPDLRNDENINVSQLQMAFYRFYNAVFDLQSGTNKQRYVRARQLVRWAYQYIVLNEYLPTVCDKHVVADTVANGPRFFGSAAGTSGLFMPLEFSVAAFRFGHSMIRPFYELSGTSGEVGIMDLLSPAEKSSNFAADGQLKKKFVIEWDRYVGKGAQKARLIDPLIAKDLFKLKEAARAADPILKQLAISNLIRGFSLSIPTGQAICDGFGVTPLTANQLAKDEPVALQKALKDYKFADRTPLWFYVLKEAKHQTGGTTLGEVGSRMVAETIVGMVKNDPNSYLNNCCDPAVHQDGILIEENAGGDPERKVSSLADLLSEAGFSL